MSHPANEVLKEDVSDYVQRMSCIDHLNFCDERGIKTVNDPMEELMDQVYEYILEQKMQS